MNTQKLMYSVLGAGIGLFSGLAMAHPGHMDTQDARIQSLVMSIQEAETLDLSKTTGQGDLTFSVYKTSKDLPAEAHKGLNAAHGGFGPDRRSGKGEVYFYLPEVGILKIAADMSTIDLVPTDAAMKQNGMHNSTVWYGKGKRAYLTFPGNGNATIYTTDLEGNLINTLETPTNDIEWNKNKVTKYFADGGKFVPTDVEVFGKEMYITTGYSSLDFVLRADIKSGKKFSTTWNGDAFGGKGEGVGQFGTGHGITIGADNNSISVADRSRSEIDHFKPNGDYLSTLSLPAGSLPCDVDYIDDYTVVGCLKGPKPEENAAPIYIVKDGEVVSTILIKDDLGLSKFTHVHNAVMIAHNDTYYVIAQAWNPGDFVILKQVK